MGKQRENIWINCLGREIPFKNLSKSHLLHIVNMVLNKIKKGESKLNGRSLDNWFDLLIKELVRRKLPVPIKPSVEVQKDISKIIITIEFV